MHLLQRTMMAGCLAAGYIECANLKGETFPKPQPEKVKLTPKIHGGWVYVFRSRHAGMIEEAAMLYRLTGERRYAQWAVGQSNFCATNGQRLRTGSLVSVGN